jgi:hypothetical protein
VRIFLIPFFNPRGISDSLIDAPLFSIYRRLASFITGISPFQSFQSFNRYTQFQMGISRFQSFQPFNRFAPFKSLPEDKVQ